MKKVFFIVCTMLILCACDDVPQAEQQSKQLNITILVDLSDRINPTLNNDVPAHWQRDIANVGYICDIFKKDMHDRGAFMARGKIRVVFTPVPYAENINSLVESLHVNFADMHVRDKKLAYDSLTTKFTSSLRQIYAATIADHKHTKKKWDGSDVWRFFKNDAQTCVDTAYRNILVVLTDGYIYHAESKFVHANRHSYMLPANIKKYRNPQWKRQVEADNFGMLPPTSDLQALEVMILDITPTSKQYDEDILRHVLQKWLHEMGVQKYNVHLTDFPVNIKPKIDRFFEQK